MPTNVKWIKIMVNVFDDEKILLIESLPEADAIIVIWFKLLTLAGKINNGGVFMLNDRIAYTDEMLATIFRRNVNTVRLALKTFQQFGMIEIVDNVITIPNWNKHQSLDAIENKREYMKNYMRERRQKERLTQTENTTNELDCKTNSKTNCKANVSSLDKDIDKDKELKEKINKKEKLTRPNDVHNEQAWNDFLKLRKAKKAPLTETALNLIRSQSKKAGITLDQAIEICCARGWTSFNASWNWRDSFSEKSRSSEPDLDSFDFNDDQLI